MWWQKRKRDRQAVRSHKVRLFRNPNTILKPNQHFLLEEVPRTDKMRSSLAGSDGIWKVLVEIQEDLWDLAFIFLVFFRNTCLPGCRTLTFTTGPRTRRTSFCGCCGRRNTLLLQSDLYQHSRLCHYEHYNLHIITYSTRRVVAKGLFLAGSQRSSRWLFLMTEDTLSAKGIGCLGLLRLSVFFTMLNIYFQSWWGRTLFSRF